VHAPFLLVQFRRLVEGLLKMGRVAIGLILLMLAPSLAMAEGRFALLIGNEAYGPAIGALANPHNDVALLERALSRLHFEVTTMRDAGLGTLHQAINAYVRRVQAGGPNAVGFFYYSGHGAQGAGTNYLIPVDVKTTESGELWDQSLRLTEITRKLKTEAGNATHFVVFDACRNALKLKQTGSRSLVQSKGFVPVSQESGMLIAYATAEGELASDVGAEAGPYAKVLAEEIIKPGIEAVTMFRRVQVRVRSMIGQEPWLGFSAIGEIQLAGNASIALQGTWTGLWNDGGNTPGRHESTVVIAGGQAVRYVYEGKISGGIAASTVTDKSALILFEGGNTVQLTIDAPGHANAFYRRVDGFTATGSFTRK
jgi:hypothetical protein